MLNNVWNSLVNEVEATKRHYDKLEAAMTTMNNRLNDGITALDMRVDKLEDVRATHTLSSQCHQAAHSSHCLLKMDLLW